VPTVMGLETIHKRVVIDKRRETHDCTLLACLIRNIRSRMLVSEPVSSVSIVSSYGMDDRAMDVRSPAEAKVFFF
jgi:hypothetical protein